MPNTRKTRMRNEVIRCENCGDDYSVTYKYCPFCDEVPARNTGGRGGKRLNNTRGGGYGGAAGPLRYITIVASVALIAAAVLIVFTIVKPLIDTGSDGPDAAATETATAAPSATESMPATAEPTAEETEQNSPEPSSSAQAAVKFTLDMSDFTLKAQGETYAIKAVFSPSGATETLTWTSSAPSVVSVAADGTVTGLAIGNSTITATMSNGYSQTCIVRCSWSGTSSGSVSSGTSGLALNYTDVTLGYKGETLMLKVTGTGSTPKWTSSDASVASVSSAGKVTAVKSGSATITAVVDGRTLKCIVRCSL